jgi:hypothetical protein
MTYTDNRRDGNEAELVAYWRSRGCLWIPMSRLTGFDGLLATTSGLYIVEIKQPGGQLTKAERARRDEIEALGGEYHVIRTLEDAAELIA